MTLDHQQLSFLVIIVGFVQPDLEESCGLKTSVEIKVDL